MCKIIDYSEKSFALVGEDTKRMKNDLRKLGGKYNPRLTCGKGWIFSNKSREGVDAYLTNGLIYVTLGDTIAPDNKEPKATKKQAKQTKKQDDIPYCYDEFLQAMKKEPSDFPTYKNTLPFKLRSGKIFTIDKPKIKTQFCFPENGGESYDIAVNNCLVLDTNEKAFINENLDKFNRDIEELGKPEPDSERALKQWWQCPNIVSLCSTFTGNAIPMSEEEREDILAILKQERAKFEKRLQSYLKRYGLSKIHTWTYWSER